MTMTAAASVFGELFARYRDKLMELCMEEAYDESRMYCYLPDAPPWQDQCVLCECLAFDDGSLIGWHTLKRVCESEECRRLWAWIEARGKGSGGTKRRQLLKQRFGGTIWDVAHPVRREAILATMLEYESLEQQRVRKQRLRVAA